MSDLALRVSQQNFIQNSMKERTEILKLIGVLSLISVVVLAGSISFSSFFGSAKAQLSNTDEDMLLFIEPSLHNRVASDETPNPEIEPNESVPNTSINEPEAQPSDSSFKNSPQSLDSESKFETDQFETVPSLSDARAVQEAMLELYRRLAEYESLNRDATEQIERLENDNHALKKRVSFLEAAFANIQKTELLEDKTLENALNISGAGADVKVEAEIETKAVSSLSLDQKLLLAETQLASGHNPEDVAKDIKALLQDAPKDYKRSSVALYVLGETYLLRKMYEEATATYAASYKKSANAGHSKDKASASLFKLSFSLGRQGERVKSCLALTKLRRDYKNLEKRLSIRADRLAETYGCETRNSE